MSEKRFSRGQIWLHWGVAVVLAVAYFSSSEMKHAWFAIRRGTEASYPVLHIVAGSVVLALLVWRLALRVRKGTPDLPEGTPRWVRIASHSVQWGIYLLLLLMPLTGLAAWFGGVTILGDIHEVLFNFGVALVFLHVAGAFFHHFVLRDGLIGRMMRPG